MTFLWGLDLGPRRAAPVDPPMGGVGRTQGPHRYHGGAGSGRPLAGVSYPREIPLISGKAGRKAESTFFEGKGAELAFFIIQNGGIVEKIAKLNVFREKEPNRPSSPRAERQSEIRIGRERNSRGQRREPRLYPRGYLHLVPQARAAGPRPGGPPMVGTGLTLAYIGTGVGPSRAAVRARGPF